MKLFKTSNGLTMLECQPYSWLVDHLYRENLGPRLQRPEGEINPLVFTINLGGMEHSVLFEYIPLKQLLIFNEVVMFVETFHEASIIVDKCLKGLMTDEEITKEVTGYNTNYSRLKETIYGGKIDGDSYDGVSERFQEEFKNLYKEYNILLREQKFDRLLDDDE